MNLKLILIAMLSGGLGFLLAVALLPRGESVRADIGTSRSLSEASREKALAKPTSLLRRHERQSPEAVTETESIIAEVLRRKEARLAEIQQRARGFPIREDVQEQQAVEREAELELQSRLSPEEYYHHKGQAYKATDIGRTLVENLAANDAELAAIAEFEHAQANLNSNPHKDNDALHTQLRADLDVKVGAGRAQEMLNFNDPAYREVYAFARRFGLETSVALQISELKAESYMRYFEIYKSQPIDPSDPISHLKQARQSASERLIQLVGEEAAQIYIRDAEHGGWLR